MNIPFSKPTVTGREQEYINEAIRSGHLCGDGPFTKKCTEWFNEHLKTVGCLLTPSCTHALEMSAILLDIQPGDEVIMPSYTFVSTANAFVLRGAKIVFVDIRKDNLNIDETKIEAAITEKTKVIVPVHYAGVACEMDTIMALANKYGLFVVEDAAQALMSSYKGKPLGTIGHFGTFSFHATKNFTSGGEGGLLIINDERFMHRAEVFREKGTDRSAFLRGSVDKYTWRDVGSSMLPSELQAAYLWAQLENIHEINEKRLAIWHAYYDAFALTSIPHSKVNQSDDCRHNGHIFYLLSSVGNIEIIGRLKEFGIQATSHYEPLHTSSFGQLHGRVSGDMDVTPTVSKQIVRLPVFDSINVKDIGYVVDKTLSLSFI